MNRFSVNTNITPDPALRSNFDQNSKINPQKNNNIYTNTETYTDNETDNETYDETDDETDEAFDDKQQNEIKHSNLYFDLGKKKQSYDYLLYDYEQQHMIELIDNLFDDLYLVRNPTRIINKLSSFQKILESEIDQFLENNKNIEVTLFFINMKSYIIDKGLSYLCDIINIMNTIKDDNQFKNYHFEWFNDIKNKFKKSIMYDDNSVFVLKKCFMKFNTSNVYTISS